MEGTSKRTNLIRLGPAGSAAHTWRQGKTKDKHHTLVQFHPVGDCSWPLLRVAQEAGGTFWVLLACPVHIPRDSAAPVSSGHPEQLRQCPGTVTAAAETGAEVPVPQLRYLQLLCSSDLQVYLQLLIADSPECSPSGWQDYKKGCE